MCWLHKWIVKDKEILPSLIEQAGGPDFELTGTIDPSRMSCIVTYLCSECGREKVVRL